MKNNERKKNKRGMTLVEVIVSVALLSIVVIFFCSVFVYFVTILSSVAKLRQATGKAAGGIEAQAGGATDSSPDYTAITSSGSFSIDFGGNTVTVDGSYIESKNDDAKYNGFAPTP